MATQKPIPTQAGTSSTGAPKRSSTKAAVKKPIAASKHLATSTSAKTSDAALTSGQAGELSKKELLEAVVAESGMKKGEARRALDAVLSVMHGALSEGKDISAAPLGKIKIARKKQTPNGELAVLRVKLKTPGGTAPPKARKDPVADTTD